MSLAEFQDARSYSPGKSPWKGPQKDPFFTGSRLSIGKRLQSTRGIFFRFLTAEWFCSTVE